MIVEQHEIARIERAFQSAGRVAREQDARAERMHHAHREGRRACGVALIHMKPATERDDFTSAQCAGVEPTSMAFHGGGGKAGNLLIGHFADMLQSADYITEA